MKQFNLLDSNFSHHPNNSVAYNQTNDLFDWYRGGEVVNNTCFFTDNHLHEVERVKNVKRKVAWLIEPRAINPGMYEWIQNNHDKFDYVLTFDRELLRKDLSGTYLFYPYGTTWIKDFENLHIKKTKLVSLIGSNKSMTPGHAFRKQVIEHCLNRGDVDVFGRGYNEILTKEEGLIDYRFSIVLENSKDDWYFSEKLIDCIVTKTIPIYWGSHVQDFLDTDSILTFESIKGLDNILDAINFDMAELLDRSLELNLRKVKEQNYHIPEKWIFNKYPFLFE